MTTAIANAEELFRFASLRAPNAIPPQPGLLVLENEAEIPAWLASPLPDFAVQLDTLGARWSALVERGSDAINADLQAIAHQADAIDPARLFPVLPACGNARALDALLTGLWKFFLQGVASGAATTEQLTRAQQLMGQVNLLHKLAASGAPVLDAEAVAGALAPVVQLPALFEQQLQLRRDEERARHATRAGQARVDQDDALAILARSLGQLEALEQRLVTALEAAIAADQGEAGQPPAAAGDTGALEKKLSLQPAADSAKAFRQQHAELLQQLEEAGLATATLNPFQLLDAVRRRIADAVLTASRSPLSGPAAPALLAAHPALRAAPREAVLASDGAPVQFGIRAAGVADLKVVRQVLVQYDKGELAHIENVLEGEERERYYSRLQRVDQGEYAYSEQEIEQTRETASTERFELGQFTYQYAHEQQDEYNSVSISANYGDISLYSSTNLGWSRSEDVSRGDDLRLSYEVVNRAVNTVRERVGRQRFITLSEEISESTVHRQSAEGANVVGQYRWIDKVYQAQVYNYGARAMYEIMVPRPAAMFTHLLAQRDGVDAHAGPAPVRPAIAPADITDASWALFAERYGVDLPAPPPAAITEFAQASYPLKNGSRPVIQGVFKGAEATRLGYLAATAGCSIAWYGVAGQSGVTASIGTRLFASSGDGVPIPSQALGAETGDVSFNASGWGALDQYTVNFYLVWTRSQRALEQWQLACHQKIMARYDSDLAAWRERAAAHGSADGKQKRLAAQQMRQIERTELKRAVLEIVRNGNGIAAPAPAISQDGVPVIHADRLEAAAREVRFVEYAFEWDQMTYRFYPYFWNGSAEQWSAQQVSDQGDRLFTAFLNAGFASVVLPVRPGYEDAAALYLRTGLILDLPVAPADEALARLNRDVRLRNRVLPLEGIADGQPWTYRVPTTLVMLEDGTSGVLARIGVDTWPVQADVVDVAPLEVETDA